MTFQVSMDGEQGKRLLTDEPITFSLVIMENASFVGASMPDWPQGVKFVSAHITGLLPAAQGRKGTKITIVLLVTEAGEYSLPPVTILVKEKARQVAFDTLHIEQNPQTAIPSITLMAEDAAGRALTAQTVDVCSAVRLVLETKYIGKVESVKWDVPDNVILQAQYMKERTAGENPASASGEKGSSAEEGGRMIHSANGYSSAADEAALPAAFLWQPLQTGTAAFPVVYCNVVALNGQKRTIHTQDKVVTVTEGAEESGEAKKTAEGWETKETVQVRDEESLARADEALASGEAARIHADEADARDESGRARGEAAGGATVLSPNPKTYNSGRLAYEECKKLAQMRQKERRSIFPSKIRHERIEYEKALGIEKTVNEMSLLPFVLCIALCAACASLSAAAIRKKIYIKHLLFAAAASSFLFASLAILCASVLLSARGVFAGSVIYSIPEKTSSAASLQAGLPVRVLDAASSYVYVQCASQAGWADGADVIIL